jgi:hypothetical protein
MRTSGEAASRSTAISDAHEAIGEGLRANGSPETEGRPLDPACDISHVLHILHGARSLPFGRGSGSAAALREYDA